MLLANFDVAPAGDIAMSPEDNRNETQQALLRDTLAALKQEENRISFDAWMFEQPRCSKR